MATEFDLELTFENFVVGGSNRLAHASALSVINHPGERYNPLYFYGPAGVGKTHLLHAIWQKARSENHLVLYLNGQQYRDKVLWAIKNNERNLFLARYSSLDFLLFDDINDLGGTEEAQEQFFHWFNHLHDNRTQIVIAGSHHPRSMPLLDDRLRSRFEWGLITEIALPNSETYLAILQAKSQIGQASLEATKETPVVITPDSIIRVTGAKFEIPADAITGPKRDKIIALARHVTMFLMREETALSLADIGREVGNRDHSTVVHAYKRIETELQNDSRLFRQIQEIKEALHL